MCGAADWREKKDVGTVKFVVVRSSDHQKHYWEFLNWLVASVEGEVLFVLRLAMRRPIFLNVAVADLLHVREGC